MQGLLVFILHTVGRETGKARQSPILYIQEGENYAVVGSSGGSDAPPAWWLNLQAKPHVTIEIKGTKQPVSARIATPEEKALSLLATTRRRLSLLQRLPGAHSA